MKWLVLVLVLIAGSANAQVFKPRSKLMMKKVDLKTPAAVAPTPVAKVAAPTPPVTAKKTPTKSSRVARDNRPDDLTPAPPKKKKTAKKKHKSADDDDDVKVSDDDDDVKVSDD